MAKTVLNVEGMSCEHCVSAVKSAIESVPGVKDVVVDLEKKTAVFDFDPDLGSLEKIKAEIEDQGFEVVV